MADRIIHLEVNGIRRLGFDTGLSAQAFAQAKIAQWITQEGCIVLPEGGTAAWQPGGVAEQDGSMVVWGPNVEGERLDQLLAEAANPLGAADAPDRALEALRRWIAGRSLEPQASPWPAGVLIAQDSPVTGTVFFPPERLQNRSIPAEGEDAWLDGAESLINRDLTGEAAAVFTAGAMLYRIFAKALPFPNRNRDLLHQDIREGVFLPLELAAPGLDPDAADLVNRAIAGMKGTAGGKPVGRRPTLKDLADLLGEPGAGAKQLAAFFHTLSGEEQEKLQEERDRFKKRRNMAVGTRRFMIRNTTIITGIAAALVIAALVVNSMVAAARSRPTTAGMEPRQVIETYYKSIGTLDHPMMEACVLQKAGQSDIDMVIQFFVASKIRQSYEQTIATLIPAEEWFALGSPDTSAQVFGVTDLAIIQTAGDVSTGQVQYRAQFILWIPGEAAYNDEGQSAIEAPGIETEYFIPPRGYTFTDELTLVRSKENWRIIQLDRNGI
ncbi:MAG: hypothetical protein LBT39_01565 [Treponema sp.]|jgi:hypothetical protein|nr:hypothetical protein [Treponema sp.]